MNNTDNHISPTYVNKRDGKEKKQINISLDVSILNKLEKLRGMGSSKIETRTKVITELIEKEFKNLYGEDTEIETENLHKEDTKIETDFLN